MVVLVLVCGGGSLPNSWCLLNFFITFSILLQPFRVFAFSFSNLFFVLVNFDMKISFLYFFSWNWGVGGFGFFGCVGGSCLLILFLNLKLSRIVIMKQKRGF